MKKLAAVAVLAALALAGCGNTNLAHSNAKRLEKGVYETHIVTQEGRHVTCLVLTKEFTSGDVHALSITCPDFLNPS